MQILEFILTRALALIVVLGILVVVHEWGHFIVARIFKIRVDEFSLGFGPRMFRVGKRGDTEYNVRWVPLGGYVKIAGMEADEEPINVAKERAKSAITKDDDPNRGELPLIAENTPDHAESEEQRLRDEKDGFYSKPVWQRSLVIFAGPFMSFVLGWFIFCLVYVVIGVTTSYPVVKTVNVHSEAAKIGMIPGDRIVAIDKVPIKNGDDMIELIHGSVNKKLTLTIDRNGKQVKLVGTPQPFSAAEPKIGVLGFLPTSSYRHVRFMEAIHSGNDITVKVMQGLWQLVSHHKLAEFRQSAGGPIFIGEMVSETLKIGLPAVLVLMGQLSISLAIFNLLPIPILDGGHLLIFFVESLRRGRRLTMAQQQNFMLAGLAIIGVLFVLIMANDIHRKLTQHGPLIH